MLAIFECPIGTQIPEWQNACNGRTAHRPQMDGGRIATGGNLTDADAPKSKVARRLIAKLMPLATSLEQQKAKR